MTTGDGELVIDGDGHVMEPPDLWSTRMEEALGRAGGYDSVVRLADMDRVGIDAAVLYPSSAMFFGPTDPIKALHDHEFVLACQRAYNDWLIDYCSADTSR